MHERGQTIPILTPETTSSGRHGLSKQERDNPATYTHLPIADSYANKHWNGLIRDFFAKRVQCLVDQAMIDIPAHPSPHNCTYGTKVQHNYLKNYPKSLPGCDGVHEPTSWPYDTSKLEAAQAWCCAHDDCGGVTLQHGHYEVRAGATPHGDSHHNCSSWPRHDSGKVDVTNQTKCIVAAEINFTQSTESSYAVNPTTQLIIPLSKKLLKRYQEYLPAMLTPPRPLLRPPHPPPAPPAPTPAPTPRLPRAYRAPVWPLPMQLSCAAPGDDPGFALISSIATVTLEGPGASSAIVKNATTRYLPLLRSACGANATRGAVTTVIVRVLSANDVLGLDTNYSYTVQFLNGSNTVGISAMSPFGVAYAYETLLQLADASFCSGGSFSLTDRPDFEHRGLLIDTGRRFYPVSLVESILEGMAMVKMNVLHMFLSELCFRVESKLFPGLNAVNCTGPKPRTGPDGRVLVNSGFYSQNDIAHLVRFARARGIRVIPEFDMPGHSGGFCHGLKSAGIVCCEAGGMGVPQIQDDSAGKSVGLIKQVLKEMSALFPDPVLHIGGDETGATPPCTTADTTSFEKKIINFVRNELGKQVMGWSGAANDTPSVIVDSWRSSSWQQAAARGHRAIASNSKSLYLDIRTHTEACMWDNIAGSHTNASLLPFLLGGEVSMWQDFYVPGARTKAAGSASCLFVDNRDKDFANSTSSTIWPRAAVAAGAFWGYNNTIVKDHLWSPMQGRILRRLLARGVAACPCPVSGRSVGCYQNSYCGKVWCPDG